MFNVQSAAADQLSIKETEMQEKSKQYAIGNKQFKLREFTVADYRTVAKFMAKNNLKKFYREEDGKFKIDVGDMIMHLTMSNLLEKFLALVLEAEQKSLMFKVQCSIGKVFGNNFYSKISDVVLVEVLADFFSGKFQLFNALIAPFLPFLQSLSQPLNQLESLQGLTPTTTE